MDGRLALPGRFVRAHYPNLQEHLQRLPLHVTAQRDHRGQPLAAAAMGDGADAGAVQQQAATSVDAMATVRIKGNERSYEVGVF
jgi:hypothetical protein